MNFNSRTASPNFESGTQALPERIFSVGEDESGELYLIAGPDPRAAFNPNRPSLILRLDPALEFLFGDLNNDRMISSDRLGVVQGRPRGRLHRPDIEQSYLLGDLDGDLDHDLSDFWLFRTAYEDFNGMGSFASLIGVPEPSAWRWHFYRSRSATPHRPDGFEFVDMEKVRDVKDCLRLIFG